MAVAAPSFAAEARGLPVAEWERCKSVADS
jgi:hypothetical protein